MAESAVSSSVNLLGRILLEEGKYLWGAEQKVKELQKELLWMRSFLRKADAVQHKDEIVWMWVCEVQEYVYEAEDVIDKFVIKVVSSRRQNGWKNKMIRYSCIFKELFDLHQAASSIDSLKVKISTLSPKLEKYGLMRTFGLNTDQIEELQNDQLEQIQRKVHVENKKITGLEKNAKEIIETLTSKSVNKRFHAIYGMGGLGKSTLATKVLHDDKVKQHFPGGQAFAYVSKKFSVENVLRDLLQQLDSQTSLHNLSRNDLDAKLGEVLKKKCLVVLDDVWTKQGWDSLKASFSSWEGDTGSKLLLTTRKEEVAKYVDDEALQKPDLLNDEKSLLLLQETMRWDLKKSLAHEQNQSEIVPSTTASEKIELVKKMLKVCKGLPLAIVVLGGILRKKQSVSEWKSVLDDISLHLLTGYDHGRSCMEIVLQSYDDLHYHLKPCFLHLAIFPEDYEIKTERLYWMWIGEGLVTKSAFGGGGGGGRSKSIEDVANVYLRDLAEAGLVQVEESTSDGWIKSIRMHDLVRDVCLEKASADNLVKNLDIHQCNTSSTDYVFNYNDKMLLRMAIAFPDSVSRYNHAILVQDYIGSNAKYLKCIRSLFLSFQQYGEQVYADDLMRCIFSAFQVLRVLVVFGGRLQRLSSRIGKLVHLRYLSLRHTNVEEIPSSIGNLRFLEILDLRVDSSTTAILLPNTLWKLFRLRHLLLRGWYEIKGGGRLRVDTLIYLETIMNLRLDNLQTKGLLNIGNVREVSFRDCLGKESAKDILAFLKTSSHLRSCSLQVSGEGISENPEFLSLDVCTFDLEICGKIVLPDNINLSVPAYLKCLTLEKCELKDDPMGILGRLSHLQHLMLGWGCYAGTEISCKSASFPLLTTFKIKMLENLKAWEAENGSMPKLDTLEIYHCDELSRIPDILPLSLQSFTLSGVVDGCIPENTKCGAHIVSPYGFGDAEWLKDAVLSNKDQDKPVVVILGKSGAGKGTCAMKLFEMGDVNRKFDVVAKTWIPTRGSINSSSSSSCLLPVRNLEQLLSDLSSNKDGDKDDLRRMSREEVTAEIQQVMQQRKCLVILLNLELEVDDNLEEELEKTFGHRSESYGERGSKLVITSPSNDDAALLTLLPADYRLFILGPPTPLHTWKMLYPDYDNKKKCTTNAGLKWNWMRHYSGHPLSTAMFMGLLNTKENVREWAYEHQKLLNDENPMDFSQVFEMCYDDLQLQLRLCLVSLASFSDGVDVSTKKLYDMWISAGFVGTQQDTVESMQKRASTYLNELVNRGMVNVVKQEPKRRKIKCQLKFGLRDMCLAKAKEDHTLNTQTLALQLEIEPEMSDECNSSPTSLLLFPTDISIPLYNENEDKWKWLLCICKHLQLMRVLNLEGMWNTKGSLPEEVGDLTHLRYLSLRATWITQLPSSLGNLTNLRTLDLRVKETIAIPDVLWKLKCLVHLYLPREFVAQQTQRLQLSGLSFLQTLVNLDTDKVILKHLLELKLLQRLSVRRIHEELVDILAQLSPSLELCINSQIINDDPTILATKFQYLKKLKIMGAISIELKPEIFPSDLEELTLKHTRLEEDPLVILGKLPKLTRLSLYRDSFLGEKMIFPNGFYGSINLRLCSLHNLEHVYSPPINSWNRNYINIIIIDCRRLY